MTDRPVPLDDVTAIVLAGGRSARFGADKLAAELDGRPLLQHAIAAVTEVAGSVVVVAAPDGHPVIPAGAAVGVQLVRDPEPFGGPLVGLATALAATATPIAIVVGGDMPRLSPAVLRRLVASVSPSRPAVHLEVPGRIQPLPMALDAVVARGAAADVLGRGGRSLRELLRELDAAAIPAPVWLALDPSGATIVDVDRPDDLASARPTGDRRRRPRS